MGSPLGPILVNIFVGYLVNNLFLNCKSPVVYIWYVDKTFVMFKNKQKNFYFINYLNNLNKKF